MGIYKAVSRTTSNRPILESLAEAVESIKQVSQTSTNKEQVNLRLSEAIRQIKAKLNECNNPEAYSRELFEVIKAEIKMGCVSEALNSFQVEGRDRYQYSGQISKLLHQSNHTEAAIDFALQEIDNLTSAQHAIELLAEVYPEYQSEIVQRTTQVITSIMQERESSTT